LTNDDAKTSPTTEKFAKIAAERRIKKGTRVENAFPFCFLFLALDDESRSVKPSRFPKAPNLKSDAAR